MIFGMSSEEFRRAATLWGIAVCVLSAASGWVFMRFGQAWSIADLPLSDLVDQIVPAYVVTEVALIPVGAKLVDKYGCKPMLVLGAAIYILASMMCMVSTSVEMLIVFRFIQGIGGGLILGMAFTSVGKFYAPDQRGKTNELLTGAFAIGSLFSSAMGYWFTDTFNWRAGFVFFSVLMLIGMAVAWFMMPKENKSDDHIDIPAMVLAVLVFASAAAYTQLVNISFDLFRLKSGLFVLFIIALVVLLVYRSYHCDGSTMPTRTTNFQKTHIALMFMFSLCGLGLIQYFFKLYLTYYEFDIYKASLMFFCMLAGAAMTSMVGGRLVFRTGARPWIVGGSSLVVIGLLFTHQMADQGLFQFGLSLFVFGVGLGCIVTEILCSYQSVMPYKDIGQHTGNLMAVRMIGILSGNALIGAYISNVIDKGRTLAVIDIGSGNPLASLSDTIAEGLDYVASTLDAGFLTTTVILAMIVAVLTAIAHTMGKDDVKSLEAYRKESEEEKKE